MRVPKLYTSATDAEQQRMPELTQTEAAMLDPDQTFFASADTEPASPCKSLLAAAIHQLCYEPPLTGRARLMVPAEDLDRAIDLLRGGHAEETATFELRGSAAFLNEKGRMAWCAVASCFVQFRVFKRAGSLPGPTCVTAHVLRMDSPPDHDRALRHAHHLPSPCEVVFTALLLRLWQHVDYFEATGLARGTTERSDQDRRMLSNCGFRAVAGASSLKGHWASAKSIERACDRFIDFWSVRSDTEPDMYAREPALRSALVDWHRLERTARAGHLGSLLPSTTAGAINDLVGRSVRVWAEIDFPAMLPQPTIPRHSTVPVTSIPVPRAVKLEIRDKMVAGEISYDLDDADREGPSVPILRLRVTINVDSTKSQGAAQPSRTLTIVGFEPERKTLRHATFSTRPTRPCSSSRSTTWLAMRTSRRSRWPRASSRTTRPCSGPTAWCPGLPVSATLRTTSSSMCKAGRSDTRSSSPSRDRSSTATWSVSA